MLAQFRWTLTECSLYEQWQQAMYCTGPKPPHTPTTILRPLFRDHPGEPMPEENFWTLWCKRRLTEADTLTIRLSATPSGLTIAHLHHPPIFLQAGFPSCHPTNSVKALKATSTFGLGKNARVLLNGVTCTYQGWLICGQIKYRNVEVLQRLNETRNVGQCPT